MNPRKNSSRKNHRLRVPGVRWLPGVLIFLLLGAILNVAVAWGCCLAFNPFAVRIHKEGHESGLIRAGDSYWIVKRRHSPVFLYIDITCSEDISDQSSPNPDHPSPQMIALWMHGTLDQIINEVSNKWAGETRPYEMMDFAHDVHTAFGVGWPSYSMWYEYDPYFLTNADGIAINWRPYKRLVGKSGRRVLPLRVIPTYFILNTLFYAISLWLLFPGRYMLRRRRRIRRGRCGQCGYLVAPNIGVPGASPNCPECGTPIPPAPGIPIPGTRITNPGIVRHDA